MDVRKIRLGDTSHYPETRKSLSYVAGGRLETLNFPMIIPSPFIA